MYYEIDFRNEALEIKKLLPDEIRLFYCESDQLHGPHITAYNKENYCRFTFEGYSDWGIISIYGGIDGLRRYVSNFLMYGLGLILEFPKALER